MNARQCSRLVNINRRVILALTVSGLPMDGLQLADPPCTLAVFVWLPLCTRLEAHVLHWTDQRHRRTDRHEISTFM
jgi:hypothetical protein